jgi:hypothetical protein
VCICVWVCDADLVVLDWPLTQLVQTEGMEMPMCAAAEVQKNAIAEATASSIQLLQNTVTPKYPRNMG